MQKQKCVQGKINDAETAYRGGGDFGGLSDSICADGFPSKRASSPVL